MLGVIPGSFSSLRSEARFRSMGAGASGAWRRWKRLHPAATSAAASTRTASRAGARGMGPRSLPCPPPSTEEAAEPVAQAPSRRPDGASAAAHGAADLLADGRPRLAVEPARLRRLRPGEEGLVAALRAPGGGELAGGGIDLAPHHVGRPPGGLPAPPPPRGAPAGRPGGGGSPRAPPVGPP